MLYCGLSEVTPGMTVAASVLHPRRPEVELLAPGVALDPPLLARLRSLGVVSVWVDHDLTRDLDSQINATPSKPLQTAFQQLKHDFGEISRKTVSAGHVQAYRQIVMDLVCELIANRNIAGLTERLVAGPASLFTHGANVAYLSISTALDLELYVVKQRRQMALEHARDLTALGIGAMLHDIGKTALDPPVPDQHDLTLEDEEQRAHYRQHPLAGYNLLRDTRAPASARQIVLSHHQRWDGLGFPNLTEATQGRRDGTQQGEGIHVFSRIVAAANVLDHLMHETLTTDAKEAGAPPKPVVAALHRFASDEFDGWFDPIVRDAMLRRIPPFAVGSRVVLSDERAAVVTAPSLEQPCRPTVRLLDETIPHDEASIDLRLHRGLSVVRCGGVDVSPYLFELIERSPLALEALTGRVA